MNRNRVYIRPRKASKPRSFAKRGRKTFIFSLVSLVGFIAVSSFQEAISYPSVNLPKAAVSPLVMESQILPLPDTLTSTIANGESDWRRLDAVISPGAFQEDPRNILSPEAVRAITRGLVTPHAKREVMNLFAWKLSEDEVELVRRAMGIVKSASPKTGDGTARLIAESVVRVGRAERVHPALILAIGYHEGMQDSKRYNPMAVSYADARGIMQVHAPTWCSEFGVTRSDLHNIPLNILYGTRIFRKYYNQTGSFYAAMRKYVGGNVPWYLQAVPMTYLKFRPHMQLSSRRDETAERRS